MAASGMVYVVMRRGHGWVTVGLVVEDAVIVLAPPYLRRIVGGCARRAWRELARNRRVEQLLWLPDEVEAAPVRTEAQVAVLDRLRRTVEQRAVA